MAKPTDKPTGKSRYALKRMGLIQPRHHRKLVHRDCDDCGSSLPGKRGHGFPSRDGKRLSCGRCFIK